MGDAPEWLHPHFLFACLFSVRYSCCLGRGTFVLWKACGRDVCVSGAFVWCYIKTKIICRHDK